MFSADGDAAQHEAGVTVVRKAVRQEPTSSRRRQRWGCDAMQKTEIRSNSRGHNPKYCVLQRNWVWSF